MAFKPYDLASLKVSTSTRRRTVEIISHPFPSFDGIPEDGINAGPDDRVKVRMVPGEPTTLAEVAVADLIPHVKHRYCHVARVRSAFVFPEDMLRYDAAALFDHTLFEGGPVDLNGFSLGLRPDCFPVEDDQREEGLLIYKTSDSKRHPWTDARWGSFSCQVRGVLIRDLRTEREAVAK